MARVAKPSVLAAFMTLIVGSSRPWSANPLVFLCVPCGEDFSMLAQPLAASSNDPVQVKVSETGGRRKDVTSRVLLFAFRTRFGRNRAVVVDDNILRLN